MVSVSVEVVRARTVILYSCVYPTQTNAVMDRHTNAFKAFLHAETEESAAVVIVIILDIDVCLAVWYDYNNVKITTK